MPDPEEKEVKIGLRFLTKKVMKDVLESVQKQITFPTNGHLVVIGPNNRKNASEVFPKNYKLGSEVIYEESFGDESNWKRDFKGMAQCQALNASDGRSSSRKRVVAALLFEGDTPNFGSCKDESGLLVVAFSGHSDNTAISRLFLYKIIESCENALLEWEKENPGKDFLQFL
jgi:hypothetical protein